MKRFSQYRVMSRPVDKQGWWIERDFETLFEAEEYADSLEDVIMTMIVKI